MSFKNKNIVREFPFFSHFACIPLVGEDQKNFILNAQMLVEKKLASYGFNIENHLKRHSHLLGHLTLLMLTLNRQDTKDKLQKVLISKSQHIKDLIKNFSIQPTKIKYFARVNKSQKCNQVTVIYLEIDQESKKTLTAVVDYLVRVMIESQIIVPQELKAMRIIYNHKSGFFQPEAFHISLFRCKGLMEKEEVKLAFREIDQDLEFEKEERKKRLNFSQINISTMMAFDETGFYQPFYRIIVFNVQNQNNQEMLE